MSTEEVCLQESLRLLFRLCNLKKQKKQNTNMFQTVPVCCFILSSVLPSGRRCELPSWLQRKNVNLWSFVSIFLTLLSDGGLWKSGKSQTESLVEQLACVLRGRLAHLKSSLCFARDSGLQCCLWPHPSPFSWQPQYGNLVRCGAEMALPS